jgi:hypothetical protein
MSKAEVGWSATIGVGCRWSGASPSVLHWGGSGGVEASRHGCGAAGVGAQGQQGASPLAALPSCQASLSRLRAIDVGAQGASPPSHATIVPRKLWVKSREATRRLAARARRWEGSHITGDYKRCVVAYVEAQMSRLSREKETEWELMALGFGPILIWASVKFWPFITINGFYSLTMKAAEWAIKWATVRS